MKYKLFVLLTFIAFSPALAQKDPVYNNKSGAIEGYDAVAYFNESKAVKGSSEFTYEWNNTTWSFSSEKNLTSFKENPEKYAPQFGGYCAYAVSKGNVFKSSPEAWTIVGGKLYLNFNKMVQKKWLKDQDSLIKLGESNWPKVIDK